MPEDVDVEPARRAGARPSRGGAGAVARPRAGCLICALRPGREQRVPFTFADCLKPCDETLPEHGGAAAALDPARRGGLPLLQVAPELAHGTDRTDAARRGKARAADYDARVAVHDLAVIVVSHNQAHWLPPLPAHISSAPGRSRSTSSSSTTAERRARPSSSSATSPTARLVSCENRGFAHANNRGLRTLRRPLRALPEPGHGAPRGHARGARRGSSTRAPDVGVVGVRQVDRDGALYPTMRRFPSSRRVLGDALGLERLPGRPAWLGERELRLERYDGESSATGRSARSCSSAARRSRAPAASTSGSSSTREEVDFCLRVQPRRVAARATLPDDDDPPPRPERELARGRRCADRAAERVRAAPVRAEELPPRVPGRLPRRAAPALRAPLARRRRRAAARGRARGGRRSCSAGATPPFEGPPEQAVDPRARGHVKAGCGGCSAARATPSPPGRARGRRGRVGARSRPGFCATGPG